MNKKDIMTARRCMDYKLLKCGNKDCTNESCPLNKIYDEIAVSTEVKKC